LALLAGYWNDSWKDPVGSAGKDEGVEEIGLASIYWVVLIVEVAWTSE